MQSLVEWTLLIVAGVAGLGGAGMILRGVRGRRMAAGRVCPRCRYDMRAIEGRTCPECGRTAAREESLTPRRRSWRRVVAGLVLLGVAIPAFGMHHAAKDMGWKSLVPETIWIVAAGCTASETPMEEMGFDPPTFGNPAAHLWPWQRSLLAWSMRRRSSFEDPTVREGAFTTLAWVTPKDREPTGADAEVFARLAEDPSPRVRGLALGTLAERLDAPESDPRIRAALDAPPGDEATEQVRATVFFGTCFRYLGVRTGSADPRLLEIIRAALPDEGILGAAAPRVARMAAERGLCDPTLVAPLLRAATAATPSRSGVACAALDAAWRHASDELRPQVAAACIAIAPQVGEGDRCRLVWMAKDFSLPGGARDAVLRAALASGDRTDLDEALDLCGRLADEELGPLAEPTLAAIQRHAALVDAGLAARHDSLRRRVEALAKPAPVEPPPVP